VLTQLPLKVEEETHCDCDHCGSEGNRCHSIIQSLNAHRIVILRVIIERMFCTVVEYVGLFFDILLTPEKLRLGGRYPLCNNATYSFPSAIL